MLGTHLLSHWCRVQGQIVLSAWEAELKTRARELSVFLSKVDANACKGILGHGVWKLKHFSLKCMWVQEVIRNEQVQVVKIPRDSNVEHIHLMGGCWTAVDN